MDKIVITDVDGTLVKDGTLDLNPEYYEVMDELVSNGLQVVICSGRAYSSVAKLFKPLIDKLYFICDGGTSIWKDGKIIKSFPMDQKLWKGMYKDAMKIDRCDCFVSTGKNGYAVDSNSEMYHWLTDSYGFEMTQIDDIDEIKDPVIKLSVFHPEDCEIACHDTFIPAWQDKAKLASAGSAWVDCVDQDANKGAALMWLQEYLNIEKEDCYAFGDNINDVEMLQSAGHSYAVDNARDELKAVSDKVIKPYWEFGVLEVMKSLVG